MKKRFLLLLLTLACALCLGLGLAACGDTDKTVSLSPSTSDVTLNLKDDDNKTADITITVKNAPASYELVWTSANNTIATVSGTGNTGTITAAAKGNTTVTVSLKDANDVTPVTIAVSVKEFRPWTDSEEAAMKEHLHGIVLEPTSKDDMAAKWDDKAGQITVEGDWAEGSDLSDYASLYTAENGWVEITDDFNVEYATAFIFEKAVETEDGTRYVRVYIYATDDGHGSDLVYEGVFYIVAEDPYVYAWPTAYFASITANYRSDLELPSVEAQHYYVYYGLIVAYYDSNEEDGGYGAILEAADYTVKKDGEHYSALSPDGLFDVHFIYDDGELLIWVSDAIFDAWPAHVIAKYIAKYAERGAVDTGVPALVGEGLSFRFEDYYFNDSSLTDDIDLHGSVIVSGVKETVYNAYIETLTADGWVKLNETNGIVSYQKAADDGKVAHIKISYNSVAEQLTVDIYYVLRIDASNGWDAAAVAAMIAAIVGADVTDVLPAYTGTIADIKLTSDTINITVPEEEFSGVADRYIETVLAAGFTEQGSSPWLMRYFSPNNEYKLTIGSQVSNNNLSIRIEKV